MTFVRVFGFLISFLWFNFSLWATEGSKNYGTSLPFLEWRLELDLSGFDVKLDKLSLNAQKRFLHAVGEDSNFVVSVQMDQYSDSKDCNKCRIYFVHKLKPDFVPDYETLFLESGDTAYWEFTVKEYEGMKVDHKNLNIVLARDSICMNIHISKLHYKDEDSIIFNRIKNSVKIVDKSREVSESDKKLYDSFIITQAEPLRREIMDSKNSLMGMLAYIHSLDELELKFKLIDKFINLKPGSGIEYAYLEKGILYIVKNDFKRAEFQLSLALSSLDDNYIAWNFLGMAQNGMKKYREAINSFDKAIELYGASAHPYLGRAEAYWRLKEYDKAIADYTAILNFDTRVEDAYVYRGIVYKKTEQYEKALKDWKKVIELNKEWEKELKPLIKEVEEKLHK